MRAQLWYLQGAFIHMFEAANAVLLWKDCRRYRTFWANPPTAIYFPLRSILLLGSLLLLGLCSRPLGMGLGSGAAVMVVGGISTNQTTGEPSSKRTGTRLVGFSFFQLAHCRALRPSPQLPTFNKTLCTSTRTVQPHSRWFRAFTGTVGAVRTDSIAASACLATVKLQWWW
jgi:hypothetical protein